MHVQGDCQYLGKVMLTGSRPVHCTYLSGLYVTRYHLIAPWSLAGFVDPPVLCLC